MKAKLTIIVDDIREVPGSITCIYKNDSKIKSLFDEHYIAEWQQAFDELNKILGLHNGFTVIDAELVGSDENGH